MKLTILKPCRTPEGAHQPGACIETSAECGEYLTANGYARAASALPVVETTEAKIPAMETADMKIAKPRRTK